MIDMKNLSIVAKDLETKLNKLFSDADVEYNKDESEYYSDDDENFMVFEITKSFRIKGENGEDSTCGMEVDINLDNKELTLKSDGEALYQVMHEIDKKIEGFTTSDGEVIEVEDQMIELTTFNYDKGIDTYPNGDPGYPAELDYSFEGVVRIKFSIMIKEDD